VSRIRTKTKRREESFRDGHRLTQRIKNLKPISFHPPANPLESFICFKLDRWQIAKQLHVEELKETDPSQQTSIRDGRGGGHRAVSAAGPLTLCPDTLWQSPGSGRLCLASGRAAERLDDKRASPREIQIPWE
jgi:hypothetical protein